MSLTRSRGLNQAKPGRDHSRNTQLSCLLSVANPVPTPLLFFRVTEVKGVQKGSEALRVTW